MSKRKKRTASTADASKRKYAHAFGRVYTDAEIERIGEDLLEWFRVAGNIWLKDFAIERMIGNSRLPEFADKNEYFAYCYAIAKEMQESKLMKMGMTKKFNAAMPIFALKNVAGWRDVQDMNLAGSVRVIRDNI